jgi:hypothetical protein
LQARVETMRYRCRRRGWVTKTRRYNAHPMDEASL